MIPVLIVDNLCEIVEAIRGPDVPSMCWDYDCDSDSDMRDWLMIVAEIERKAGEW